MASSAELCKELIEVLKSLTKIQDTVTFNGQSLTLGEVVAVAERKDVTFKAANGIQDLLKENYAYLDKKMSDGVVIYGVNTGYGGSADVRSSNLQQVQKALVHHLNAGFGPKIDSQYVRALMLVRANSLSKGYSGVRPEVLDCLLDFINKDVTPVIPLRGSISASGDLMPTSYVAACLMGRPDAKVIYKGQTMTVPEAVKVSGVSTVTFQAKEALAVLNAASLAYSVGACVLYDASLAMLLTQIASAMSVESLRGRLESFHPTLHECMAHPGQAEVGTQLRHLLRGSKLAVHELDFELSDYDGILKQDRYALRSIPQWLAPAMETLPKAIKSITVDINSANDNPIIDHRRNEMLHGANFMGISATVSMDQARQAIQLCGRLLFAQMSEMLNVGMSNQLPPNLCGSDPSLDFGLKGTDTAMASYTSELDWLTSPLTNHVHSAEMHNQSVNSMALVSARMSQQALEVLQMMLANILVSHCQALDLRWLQLQSERVIRDALKVAGIKEKYLRPEAMPWYKFMFSPAETAKALSDLAEVNGTRQAGLVTTLTQRLTELLHSVHRGERVQDVADLLSEGTRPMYLFIRQELKVPFSDGQRPIDNMLDTIHSAIKDRRILNTVLNIFSS